MQLKQIELEHGDAVRSSALAPKSFAEGVVNYVVRRRAALVAEFGETESTFEVERIANKIKALDRIIDAADASMPKKEWKRTPPPGKTGADSRVHLARVLTPKGWEDDILPKYAIIGDQAIADLIDKKDVEENMAVHGEVARFVRYLQNVAREGLAALPRRVA
jgi:hypothetical protein